MASEKWFERTYHRVMKSVLVVLVCGFCGFVRAEGIANFEDLTLGPQSYWNGSDSLGGFTSGSAWFGNNYDTMYGSWDGFAYSNISDTTAQGWTNQYNAITGCGQGGSANYAVGYGYEASLTPPRMVLDEPEIIGGLYVTNSNYAYYSMLYGDMFAKKFGGASGNDADWFLLTMTGKDAAGVITGTADFYLADFRFSNNSMDYIVNNWRFVNLTSLGVVKSVEFSLSSSDIGSWGMNTPGYFVIDTVVPEPVSAAIMGLGAVILTFTRKYRTSLSKSCGV
jgi:hypothetical protein